MHCKVSLASKIALSRDRFDRDLPSVFSGSLLEIYQNLPGTPAVTWSPQLSSVDLYKDLLLALDQLPELLLTTLKRSGTFKTTPVTAEFRAKRQGLSLLQAFIAQWRSLITRQQPNLPDPDFLSGLRDEFNFTLAFPGAEVDHSLHRGFGHALDTLENDLCELKDMLTSADVASVLYNCRRILRKANLLRWTVSVFLYTCVPLIEQAWPRTASLQQSLDLCVLRGFARLEQLECLVERFWSHRKVQSALTSVQNVR